MDGRLYELEGCYELAEVQYIWKQIEQDTQKLWHCKGGTCHSSDLSCELCATGPLWRSYRPERLETSLQTEPLHIPGLTHSFDLLEA